MTYIGTGVEYALHCLVWLAAPTEQRPSSRDLAEIQGVSPAFVAKIFPKLEKAGIVESSGGIRGGYRLARRPKDISVLDVVDAVEGRKMLFDCQDIRRRCALFEGKPPKWSTRGVCSIHAVMLRAEKTLRDELAATNLASLSADIIGKGMPPGFSDEVRIWFADRQSVREQARITAMRRRVGNRDDAESR